MSCVRYDICFPTLTVCYTGCAAVCRAGAAVVWGLAAVKAGEPRPCPTGNRAAPQLCSRSVCAIFIPHGGTCKFGCNALQIDGKAALTAVPPCDPLYVISTARLCRPRFWLVHGCPVGKVHAVKRRLGCHCGPFLLQLRLLRAVSMAAQVCKYLDGSITITGQDVG